MNIVQMYRTESDWCALVAHQNWRQTLTYLPAEQPPDEAQVLADAENAYMAWQAGVDFPPLVVDETTTLDEKKALARGQVVSAAQLTSTEPELDDITASLNEVVERLGDGNQNQ